LYDKENSTLLSCDSQGFVKHVSLRNKFMTINGHQGSMYKIIRMNNNYIVTCGSDLTIKYWNVISFKCTKVLSGFANPIIDLCKLNRNEFVSYEATTNEITI
jgi:WD40 repeat protein